MDVQRKLEPSPGVVGTYINEEVRVDILLVVNSLVRLYQHVC